MASSRDRNPVIAILGGGFTGAAVAYHLTKTLPPGRTEIVVVEQRETLGAGLAYSTTNPAHRINVPAAKMSLLPDLTSHFSDWLGLKGAVDNDPDATTSTGQVFPQRAVFGRYVNDTLAPFLADDRIVHRRTQAVAAKKTGTGFELLFEDGRPLSADMLVIAASHPRPEIPSSLKPVSNAQGFIADIYREDALDDLDADARVLIVGNGLTSADTIAALAERDHRGPILAVSRRGLRSRGHAQTANDPRGDFSSVPARSALDLLRSIRKELALAEVENVGWHPVLDALRLQGNVIWAHLDVTEKARLVRHLRVFWDVHRFRVAPQVEASIERYCTQGKLTITAASLQHAIWRDGCFHVGIKRRGSKVAGAEFFDAIVIATGPAHSAAINENPVLLDLSLQGLLNADPLGLGLHTTANGLAIDKSGSSVAGLFVAGPLARAAVGELMGLPEVSQHAAFIAHEILDAISSRLIGRKPTHGDHS